MHLNELQRKFGFRAVAMMEIAKELIGKASAR